MSFFDSINRPKWQHSNPDIRMAAIDELDDQAVLVELVNSDSNPGVRAHALSRVSDSDKLDELADTLAQPLREQARSQRLNQLLEDPTRLASIEDDTVLVRIASLSEDQEQIEAAMGRVGSNEVLMDVAGNHPVARVRLCAAQGIEEISMLQQLALQAKHKDKAVYLHCKELLEKHNAAERDEADRQARTQQLSKDALALSLAVDSPDFKDHFQTFNHRWQSLKESAGGEQHEQIQNALDVCAARIKNKEAELASEKEQQARITNAGATYPELIAELDELDSASPPLKDTADIRRLNTTLDGIEGRWQSAMRYAQATSQQTKACKSQLKLWRAIVKTCERLRTRQSQVKKMMAESERVDKSDFLALSRLLQQAKKLDSALPWPESHGSVMPPQLHELQETLARLENQLVALGKREKQILEQLQPLLDALRKQIEEMQVKQLDDGLKKIRQILRQLRPQQQKKFEQELKLVTVRRGEIKDWQGFAVEPKKIDLCERMQALVGSEEDPEVLAQKIKALQSEWKKLDALQPRRDQELWGQFSAAADKAWEPCKLAFARQAESRKENYQLRMQLVRQLVDYESKMVWSDAEDSDSDTDGPDWKLVQKTLNTARETFRNIGPVGRKDEHKSQKALRAVTDRIFSHIKVEYERNIVLKEDLVNRARALAELEDLKQAIERAKKIQRQWKGIGITPVGVDRRLWKEFRAACDAVFARLDKQRKDDRQALREHIEQAENLARQARALLDSEDDRKRLHLKRDLSELQAELRKLDLPREIQQKVGKQLSAMEREARDIVSQVRIRQEQQRWQHLVARMQACALKTADKKKAGGPWQEEEEIPKGVDGDALKEFWQQGPGKTAEKDLQEACIALEIFNDVESPPEDKEARMAYQMQRLVEGMGQQQQDSEPRLLELINKFIKMRPGGKWLQRFCRGIETARAPS